MSTILQQGSAPDQPGLPKERLIRDAVAWREANKFRIANPDSIKASQDEKAKLKKLGMIVDVYTSKGGQP
jgi:hypothetical protein